MKCPSCGAAGLIRDMRETSYSYNGESAAIPRLTGDLCPACGDSMLDMVVSARPGESIASASGYACRGESGPANITLKG
ncbi:type II toxin-antitoxin system MqsA family antitoxin [Trinickia sp. EG282A]|uniref:type II toxin-antitoxin system MqsA family antitoxin n=1 Tax=Trinickia sp. EG282A TaxID=3237013 RepID=UPI0034D30690